ncbi:hypothetical protein LHJ74_06660 [Streptomyces sp. N2-109]|uniref:Polyketide cyclase n=1 Tax=Streptomyces gossypii TaxID=2883101 RepID=A0ABT2JP03_9ACTN|nr:hypothetical protein [Streptomyces gossypii]MCT2589607.1 hypothetical protein [Streptomyces gossypii]
MLNDDRRWGATDADAAASYPCDRYLDKPYKSYHRAVDVDASVPLTYRWLCQLTTGDYTYGRMWRCSRTLTPGADELAVGQRFLAFELVDFAAGDHMTGVTFPLTQRLYGTLAVTYRVVPREPGGSRIVVRLNVPGDRGLSRWIRGPLALADAVIMRKQLLNLKELAQRDQEAQSCQ